MVIMAKAGIACVVCGKIYECGQKEIVEECAKRYKMHKITAVNLADGIESSVYVCQSCYARYISKLLSPYG